LHVYVWLHITGAHVVLAVVVDRFRPSNSTMQRLLVVSFVALFASVQSLDVEIVGVKCDESLKPLFTVVVRYLKSIRHDVALVEMKFSHASHCPFLQCTTTELTTPVFKTTWVM
jgi:energy-converting hydrogenase Eha subunit C